MHFDNEVVVGTDIAMRRVASYSNGWMDEVWVKTHSVVGTEVDIGAGHIVLDGFAALREGGTAPPLLDPCLLWPRSPISATAELLYKRSTKTETAIWTTFRLLVGGLWTGVSAPTYSQSCFLGNVLKISRWCKMHKCKWISGRNNSSCLIKDMSSC